MERIGNISPAPLNKLLLPPYPYPIPPPLEVDQPVAIRIYALGKAVLCHPLILSGVISGLLSLPDPPAAEKQLRWGTEAGGR